MKYIINNNAEEISKLFYRLCRPIPLPSGDEVYKIYPVFQHPTSGDFCFGFEADESVLVHHDWENIDSVEKSVDIDIDWIKNCADCRCEGDCLNDKCKIMEYDEFGSPLNPEVEEEEEVVDIVKEVEPKKPDYLLFVSLGIISVFAGIGLVWLSWFRKVSF